MNSGTSNPEQLTFLLEEPPASRSVSPDSEKAWLIHAATSRLSIWHWLTEFVRDTLYGKTCPASCRRTKDGILVPSSGRWQNSGMGSLTECWTLSIGESHKDAAVCLLSDVLTVGNVPRRYFLSAKAAQGILRRVDRRGRELPLTLRRALEQVAEGLVAQVKQEAKLRSSLLNLTLHKRLPKTTHPTLPPLEITAVLSMPSSIRPASVA